jgi:hypothetical protein
MDCGCNTSVASAQAASFQIQVDVAVAKKANDAMKLQGQAIVALLQQAAPSPPSDRPTQLDVSA